MEAQTPAGRLGVELPGGASPVDNSYAAIGAGPDSGRNGIPPTTLQQTPCRDRMATATHLSEFESKNGCGWLGLTSVNLTLKQT
jgi:hypothetical protein